MIENWPVFLVERSFRTTSLKLTQSEAKLLAYKWELSEGGGEDSRYKVENRGEVLRRLIGKLGRRVKEYPGGCFLKVESRSPKDSYVVHKEGFKVLNGEGALRRLSDSERIYEEITDALSFKKRPKIYFREWWEMAGWEEFRCFVIQGRLIAVSQYNYFQEYGGIEWGNYHTAIETQWVQDLHRLSDHYPDMVMDLWVRMTVAERGRLEWRTKIVEVNPLCQMTDPCLFSWEEMEGIYRMNSSSSEFKVGIKS